MTTADLLAALALPPETLLRQRIAKKLLLEEAPLALVDRRALVVGLEDLHVWATLKPAWCGVPAYVPLPDAPDQAVEEIVVMEARLRTAPGGPTTRLLELLHRAIPYPILVLAEFAEAAGGVIVSLAHKRPAQNAADRLTLLDAWHSDPLQLAAPVPGSTAAEPETPYAGALATAAPGGVPAAYLAAMPLPALAAADLRALYQGWLDRTVALAAAQLTGQYCPPATAAQATALRAALARHGQLRAEQASVRAGAAREKQLARRAALNLRLRQLDSELNALSAVLTFADFPPTAA